MYHDEKGRSLDKAKLVADIASLPKGYSGSIKVRDAQSRMTNDTAILTYDLDETNIFGQELHARYHETDTWLRRPGLRSKKCCVATHLPLNRRRSHVSVS